MPNWLITVIGIAIAFFFLQRWMDDRARKAIERERKEKSKKLFDERN